MCKNDKLISKEPGMYLTFYTIKFSNSCIMQNAMFLGILGFNIKEPTYLYGCFRRKTHNTVPCGARGRGFFRRADSFAYISRQWMTSLDLCLQLIPSGQGNQPPSSHRSWRPLTLDGSGWNVLYLISCQLRLIHSISINI